MLSEVRIQNFKGWRDTGPIRLAPITVFFGANSSGKSSLQQFLLMLKQTAASSDRSRVLHTGDGGTPVDLGEFEELIHHHDTSLPLTFSMTWEQQRDMRVQDSLGNSPSVSGRALTFSAEVVQADPGTGRLRVRRMGYGLAGDTRLAVSMEQRPTRPRDYDLRFEGFAEVRNKGRAWPLPAPTRFYGFPEEAVRYFQNTEFLPDFSLALERQLGAIYYLGPLRQEPARWYVWSGGTPEHVGWRGELAVEAILAAQERRFNFKRRGALVGLDEALAQWLQQLGLIESFDLAPIAEGRRHREVRVRTAGSRDTVLVTDVGFGVSQVLPVLVQCLYAEPGSTLIFEQPELHLHPRVQMELADVLIEAAFVVRENAETRGVQLIVESHSEHLLRRLQRRIAEERLRPEDVALYFCDAANGEGTISELEVDLFGNIVNWPRDFFGDQMADVAEQSRARIRRQRAATAHG